MRDCEGCENDVSGGRGIVREVERDGVTRVAVEFHAGEHVGGMESIWGLALRVSIYNNILLPLAKFKIANV